MPEYASCFRPDDPLGKRSEKALTVSFPSSPDVLSKMMTEQLSLQQSSVGCYSKLIFILVLILLQ